MKVLVVSNMGPKLSAPLQGGFVDKQVSRLKDSGLDISYFWLKWNGDSLIYKLFKYPVFFACFFFKYILSSKRYDIIHIHFYFPTIICGLFYKVFKNKKVKILVTCHGSDVYYYTPASWLYKKLSFIVDHWFFTSEKLYTRFFRKLENKTVLCAGYDDHLFINRNNDAHREIDCIFVGALDYNKGVDRLKWLVEKLPAVSFSVVGSGPLKNELECFSLSHENLSVIGQKSPSELAQLLKQSKLLLSLSRKESFGLVITEAHACYTPCVVTETDGSIAQLTGWPYMVIQNKDEQQTLDLLKSNVLDILSLDFNAYKVVQKCANQRSKVYSLTNVISEIEKEYVKLYLSSKSGVKNVR